MKKIFTLLFATAFMSTAFAQFSPKDQRDYAYGNDNGRGNVFNDGKFKKDWDDRDKFRARERDFQIDQINREYNSKIMMVKIKLFTSRYQKMRQIQCLEDERQQAIKMVYEKFGGHGGHFDNDDLYAKKGW